MLLLHISTDSIELFTGKTQHSLPYMNIERKLPVLLQQVLKETGEKKIRLINGPGSFTSLRLGCLVLNMIQTTRKHAGQEVLEIFDTSKLEIYGYAIQQQCLPPQGYIIIGQKKNIRLSRKTGTEREHTIVQEHSLQGDYFIDQCITHPVVEQANNQYMVNIQFDGERMSFKRGKKTCTFSPSDLGKKSVSHVKPTYMIEPQIG